VASEGKADRAARHAVGDILIPWVQNVVTSAPEIFIFLAVAVGTLLGRPLLKSIFFGLFVFTIGYRAGPEFFASLSFSTLSQVVLALVVGATGLIVVLVFAFTLHLDSGTAAGLAAGSLTQSSMMGTASGALSQLGLQDDVLKQQQGNIAAGYAVTYICGYIIVLLYVPLVAPKLMGVNLRDEAAKLEAALAGGAEPKKKANLLYRKFQARAYEVSAAAGRSVGQLEMEIGRRTIVERIL
jgi:putative transport protein